MREIEVTFEKIVRIGKTFEVDDETFREIAETGMLPDDLFNICKEEANDDYGNVEYDYAVEDEDGYKVVDWY